MTLTQKSALLVGLLALGGTSLAVTAVDAREGGPHGAMFDIEFSDLDVDGDGSITAEDIEAVRQARFAEMDADDDGTVSPAEFEAFLAAQSAERGNPMGQRFVSRLDNNNDGSISIEEFRFGRAGGGRMLDRADADGDGAVSAEEFEEAQAEFAERREERKGRFGHGFRRN